MLRKDLFYVASYDIIKSSLLMCVEKTGRWRDRQEDRRTQKGYVCEMMVVRRWIISGVSFCGAVTSRSECNLEAFKPWVN